MAIGKLMGKFINFLAAGEYVDYHLAAEPAPAPSTTAPQFNLI